MAEALAAAQAGLVGMATLKPAAITGIDRILCPEHLSIVQMRRPHTGTD